MGGHKHAIPAKFHEFDPSTTAVAGCVTRNLNAFGIGVDYDDFLCHELMET